MNKKYYTILILAIQIAAGFIYGYVREENADRIREPRLVGDTEDYFHNAGLPVFSLEFWTDARPPITALLWKFAGSDPEAIFKLQLFFSIASWIALAFAAAHALKTGWLKPLIFIVTLAFSLSRDVFMWDPFMGSESISLSFMALFLAAAIWLFAGWATYKAALLVILAFFFAFTRDTNAYLLLMIAGLISVVFAFSIHRHKAWMVGGAFLLIFLASSQLSLLGLRPYRAILMNTSLRIFPSEIYTEYFRQHGMPVDDRLVRMARNMQPGETFAVNMALMFDQDQEEFRQWALGPGPREYVRFLWFYKAETFQNVFLETDGLSPHHRERQDRGIFIPHARRVDLFLRRKSHRRICRRVRVEGWSRALADSRFDDSAFVSAGGARVGGGCERRRAPFDPS
ncbi:MAG: hypothetical protein L6Q49_08450 [Anaerolineales bacterium]|nr:hypothetical protein [Anaerolineales bacterium]